MKIYLKCLCILYALVRFWHRKNLVTVSENIMIWLKINLVVTTNT